MTLIISQLDATGVSQVSDRLVSIGGNPHDSRRNKTVIWVARNGIVSISVTGFGRLENRWTDRWVAEQLRGQDLGPRDGRMGTRFGRAATSFDVGAGLRTLGREASRVFAMSGLRRVRQEFVAAGWQWNRRGWCRPVMYRVHNDKGGSTFRLDPLPRYWGWERGAANLALTPDRSRSLPDGFVDQLANEDPRSRWRVLVDGIRHVADQHPGIIGRDCMAVSIPPPGYPQVDVIFEPDRPHAGRVEFAKRTVEVVLAYSPWIVSDDLAMPPQLMVGAGVVVQVGPFAVRLLGSPAEGIGAMKGIP